MCLEMLDIRSARQYVVQNWTFIWNCVIGKGVSMKPDVAACLSTALALSCQNVR
jgi:hypothetical protein